MLRWVRAFENNSMNVNLAQAGARVKTDSFGDHYKLTASHSPSKSWLVTGYRRRMIDDTFFVLPLLAHSRKPKEHTHYTCCNAPEKGSHSRAWA